MFIKVSEIIVEDRQRRDLGELDGLLNSIKEYGLIQPIVLDLEHEHTFASRTRLVTGERRLAAIKKLGWAQLEHGKHFVWLDEANRDDLRRSAVELEENLRRKELTWQEEVEAKAKLLELMQAKYGPPADGGRTRAEKSGLIPQGFGVNKLAAMLGESPGKTSQDLQLARFVKIVPNLKTESSKTSALRRAQVMISIAQMGGFDKPQALADGMTPVIEQPWILHEGNLEDNCSLIPDESVDLVYTDLPFGVDLSDQHRHAKGLANYSDSLDVIVNLLPKILSESYRVLKPDRFVVFWFGWRFYSHLISNLAGVGFSPDVVPFCWYKHSQASENPHMKYANVYGVAIVARKGSPIFIRQGQPNYLDLGNVSPAERLHVAQQPVELVERFIKDMIAPGATVLDWTAGAGTTGVAAVKNGCKAIMFERDRLCIEAIKGRMATLK
ncbi:MAG: DNA methyltransferase [Deltaproteobacteria bacterium]|nr:DNA methyltransferase [Deltaproteobacteria bacterium]